MPGPAASPDPSRIQPSPDTPPGPVLSVRVGDEDRVIQAVEARLRETRKSLGIVSRDQLTGDQKEILSTVLDFMDKAREALSARDLLRAQALADKASALASGLVRDAKSPK